MATLLTNPLIPPRPGAQPITFRASDAQRQTLERLAELYGATRSTVARAALDAGLAVLASQQQGPAA